MINYELKYNEVIGVRPNFDDTFNIVQEKPDAWKSFITNSQFESNLKKIFYAFLATKSNINERKSIWIQGTYGTGKSHSTAVVKHLLSDNVSEIEEFKKSLSDIQLRNMIDDFRKEHKAFPVVLRGAYTISNVTDMCYEIQKQTRDALNKAGINICVNTDFEKAIRLLDDPYMESFWDMLLKDDLRIYCKTKDDIRNFLKKSDKEILGIIDRRYRKINDGGFGTSSITKWLKDVQHEIANIGVADHLLIIWDEFTSLLSSQESRSILNTAQDIAEIAKEYDNNGNPEKIFLIVVTHKNIEQTDAYRLKDNEEQKLALARFVTCSYEMQPNTTYHILSSTLNRINENVLKQLIKERILSNVAVSSVVDKIADNTQGNVEEIKEKILSLYPFHPYTAYLSTFVSRQLGDAERSVFNFLNDEEVGFKKFIKNKIDSIQFMPSSYIWDFFLKINNSSISGGKLGEVINKFNLHLDTVKKRGVEYVDVFKTVLLLNALNAVVSSGEDSNERSLVTPNITNIRDCYSGIMNEEDVVNILDYFDKNNIIMKSADGIYEVSTTAISPEKLNEMLKKNSEVYNDITRVIEEYPFIFTPLNNAIGSNSGKTVRKTEIIYLPTTLKNNQIEVQLKSKFSEHSSVHICLFLSHGPAECTKIYTPERNMEELESYLRNISNLDDYKDVIFLNVETPFTEFYLTRFLDAVSKFDVHTNNNKTEEATSERKKAQGWLQKWVNNIINDGQVFVAFRGNTELLNFRSACNKISEDYIKFIFPLGLDTLKTAKKGPIWEAKSAKSIIDNILFSAKRDDVESKLKGGIQANIPALLKDDKNNYVFDNDMNILPSADENNPVVVLCKKVQEILVPSNEPIIDLYEKLSMLFKAPYGLYGNPISYAALSIALRPYIDKLFIANNGTKVDKTVMRDIVEYLFKAANGGKKHSYLDVRFSSIEELELIEELNGIFNLHETGLMHVRWKVRENFDKDVQAPIWMLKFVDNYSKDLCKVIDDLFNFTLLPDDAITQSIITPLLSSIKNNRLELTTAISKAKVCNLLDKFIRLTLKDKESNILDSDMDKYKKYVDEHMQESRPHWTEEQLNLQITKAYLDFKKKQIDDVVVEDSNSHFKSSQNFEINHKEKEIFNNCDDKISLVKEKIKCCNNNALLKDILLKLLDADNKIVDFINDNLNK